MNETITVQQQWILCIERAMRNTDVDFTADVSYGSPIFNDVAAILVEPSGIDDSYGTFIETDVDGWVRFIYNYFGTAWGAIASIVAKEGY